MEYWSKSTEEILKIFSSSTQGLNEEEAKNRSRKYGLNDIPKRKEKSALSLFVSELKNPLILTLIVISFVYYFTGGVHEAIITIAIVLVNSVIGFVQEYKSEKSLQKLCKYIRYWAKVLRDGKVVEVDTRYIVPGDIVLVETGDRIPADLRLIETDELEIDESIITGESYPVEKSSSPIKSEKLELYQMKNMAFMGTLVTSGRGKGIVVSIGMESTLGKVVGYLKAEEPLTNYQKNIKNFSNFLLKSIVAGIIFIFVMNFVTGKSIINSLLFSLALAIGIIPEALPVVITVGLTRGAVKMNKVGVIIKKLSSIEDLGDMDVLCIDKTGTITENRISLEDYVDLDGSKDIELVKLASSCVSVVERNGKLFGNPVDVSIVEHAEKLGIKSSKVVEVVPFDFVRKRMSCVIEGGEKLLLVCKGAPESVINVCRKMKTSKGILEINKNEVEKRYKELFDKGYRVIAVAEKVVEKKDNYDKDEERELILLGFLCFTDPPKTTMKSTVQSLKKLGIELKILTGDNPLVTEKVAREVGIEVTGIVTGEEIDGMDEETLSKLVEKANIFARLTPDHKVKIISTLKKNNHVVGFLGDGINDAPSLRCSDVGISVESATDVAKEAADIILTKKSLKVILDGIVEGRKTFNNTTKYILNTVSANLGNMTTLVIVSPFLNFLPMLPIQILLTNLLTDGPLLSISTDDVDEEELKKPKNWNINFIGKFSLFFGSISSVFDFITIWFLLTLFGGNIPVFRTGWFLESTLSEMSVTFAIRTKKPFYKSRPSKTLISLTIVCMILAIALVYSPFNKFFEFEHLGYQFLFLIVLILLVYFSITEMAKHVFYKRFS